MQGEARRSGHAGASGDSNHMFGMWLRDDGAVQANARQTCALPVVLPKEPADERCGDNRALSQTAAQQQIAPNPEGKIRNPDYSCPLGHGAVLNELQRFCACLRARKPMSRRK